MPNWCYTNIEINGDKKEITKLYKLFEDWTKENPAKADIGNSWLGNLVLGAKLGTLVDEKLETNFSCRGSITDMYLDDSTIHISTETAWVPMVSLFLKICDIYLKDYWDLTYDTEETGCEIQWTNNDDLIGKFVFEDCERDVYESDWTTKDVVNYLQELLGVKENNYLKLIEIANERFPDDYINAREWEYRNEYELD